ncbi:hypothetical protein CGERO_07090 [Corynebacterium gerontici]|uniref:DUF4921 domain-containing protein n=2 Tax=Corynebacterium gerontici TaxID=2079234 RepID=A0A3G6J431_9CORY|nr:hypothetical protein CGERO_07090 [Corynebacterium gerontici]
MFSRIAPIQTMADGTIKQINPFSGTEVWTVPGRGNRPLTQPKADTKILEPHDHTTFCAFCSERVFETPPEKSRISEGKIFRVRPEQLDGSADFRRVPNLFEIVTYDYWRENYGYTMDADSAQWMNKYLDSDLGREHVMKTVQAKRRAAGQNPDVEEAALLKQGEAFFGGGHDVIIGRRHFRDDAETSDELASAGTLSADEHADLIRFTIDSMADLYRRNRYAQYVAVFQNWLKPAGASFDHLHKQLVAIDDRGVAAQNEIRRLRENPNMYNEWAVDYASARNLVIAENDHAVCFAGFGHRYPTLEVFSKSATPEPWLQSPEEVRAMSDLLHACHAAAGPDVPCNEEWHHKPIGLDIPMPWRVMIKWRVSTLAGFEGGTKIYLNTLSPWDVRDRVVPRLYELRDQGHIRGLRIAEECKVERNSLRYNPLLG